MIFDYIIRNRSYIRRSLILIHLHLQLIYTLSFVSVLQKNYCFICHYILVSLYLQILGCVIILVILHEVICTSVYTLIQLLETTMTLFVIINFHIFDEFSINHFYFHRRFLFLLFQQFSQVIFYIQNDNQMHKTSHLFLY